MNILEALVPVILVTALGYLAKVSHFFDDALTLRFEKLAFRFVLPSMLFFNAATVDFPAALNFGYLVGFYLAVALSYLLAMFSAWFLFSANIRTQSVFGMGAAYSNVTVLGVPITLQVLGPKSLVPMLVVITIHNLLVYTSGSLIAEIVGDGLQKKLTWYREVLRICREIITNPISGSLVLGATFNLLGGEFPTIVEASFTLITPAALPCSLFALGAGLHRYQIQGALPEATLITCIKLLFQPLLTFYLLKEVFVVEPLWTAAGTMLAAMPVGINAYIFSRRYECAETVIASSIVMASLLSPITLTWLLWWLDF